MTISRVEVIAAVERRRRWSRDEKERQVAASLEPGASVSEVARIAGLHVSQLFRWRKELCKHGEASTAPFVPVGIGPSAPSREVYCWVRKRISACAAVRRCALRDASGSNLGVLIRVTATRGAHYLAPSHGP